MAIRILDSWALMAFFSDDHGAEMVEVLLDEAAKGKHRLYMTAIHWAELYGRTMEDISQEAADLQAHAIASLPVEVVGTGEDLKLSRQAAMYKARYRINIAAAYAAALTKDKKGELVTGDEHLRQMEKEIKILWLSQKGSP